MPKRPCPFDDDLPPQLKVHVGQKQVDNGVCKEERMRDVYGKTLNLLNDGVKMLSRKLNTSIETNLLDMPMKKVSFPRLKQERTLQQMVLSSKLELLKTDKARKVAKPKYDLCGCTRVIDQIMLTKCSYCDQILCHSCLSECPSCNELFCQNCSLPMYDSEEHNMCLSCYR